MNKVALFAILGTAMFLLSAGSAFAATPSTGTIHIQPNPTMNTNVTWSTFYNGWNPLEYSNGTANLTLNAQESVFYQNPISINPADIQTNALQGKIGNIAWNQSSSWNLGNGGTGTLSTYNGVEINTSSLDTGVNQARFYINVSEAYLPSANPAYDYISILGNLKEIQGAVTGDGWYLTASNLSLQNFGQYGESITNASIKMGNYYALQPGASFVSMPLSNFMNNIKDGFINIGIGVYMPNTATNGSNVQQLQISGMALTTSPMTLGSFINATGTHTVSAMTQGFPLNQFNPNFAWSKVSNNGYSVAVSQPLQNLTTQQNAISSGNYIEQVEYQGNFALPTAPDLSYGPANLTEQFNVSTAQTQVLDINGVSYLSTISGKNGTVQLLTTVNPNQATQFLQIVDYTQSQWNSISVAPGIFTIAGIEYYWWIAVGGLATLIGLAAAAKHAGTKADQERIRRGR